MADLIDNCQTHGICSAQLEAIGEFGKRSKKHLIVLDALLMEGSLESRKIVTMLLQLFKIRQVHLY